MEAAVRSARSGSMSSTATSAPNFARPERDALADPAAGAGHDGRLTREQDVGRVERGVERVAGDFERLSLIQVHERSPVCQCAVGGRTLW